MNATVVCISECMNDDDNKQLHIINYTSEDDSRSQFTNRDNLHNEERGLRCVLYIEG